MDVMMAKPTPPRASVEGPGARSEPPPPRLMMGMRLKTARPDDPGQTSKQKQGRPLDIQPRMLLSKMRRAAPTVL
eukprot:7811107-Alexandrium_andersonii.AAC.1